MNIGELNAGMRDFFKKLEEDGHNKNALCKITLGPSFTPQFTKFMNGTDLGLNPLTRMFQGLGFDIHIVPVKQGDTSINDIFDNQFMQVLDVESNITSFLNNEVIIRRPPNNKSTSTVVDDIMSQILD